MVVPTWDWVNLNLLYTKCLHAVCLCYLQGIPTTRAGCVITSDTRVTRDEFYTGNPKQERCSIVLRVAPTFIRFGSFEIFKPTDSTTGWAAWLHDLTPQGCSWGHML